MDGFEILRFVQHDWPTLRGQLPSGRISLRCERCAASERRVELIGGVCLECRDFVEDSSSIGEDTTELQGTPLRQTGDWYSAVVMVSGGKDSAWTLWEARRRRPDLSLLAVTVDNGFMRDETLGAIASMTRRLEIDWLLVPEGKTCAIPLRQAFLSLGDQGCSQVVDHADGTAIYEAVAWWCERNHVGTVLCGLTSQQIDQHGALDNFEKASGGKSRLHSLIADSGVTPDEIVITVSREQLLPRHLMHPLTSNSDLLLAMLAVDQARLGYSSFEPEFCSMIRTGAIEKTHWLHVLEAVEYLATAGALDDAANAVLKKLGLTLEGVVKCRQPSSPERRDA